MILQEQREDPKIIYESEEFIVVSKPAGLLVHPINAQDVSKTLIAWVKERYPKIKTVGDNPEIRPGVVHRLDRDTSGVILIALTENAFAYFKNLFQKHEIKKRYLALVLGIPSEEKGMIDKPIRSIDGSVKRTVWGKGESQKKEARTNYEILKSFEYEGQTFSLLSVHPETGRTHQIRVHLNSINTPVMGDMLYGGERQRDIAKKIGLTRQFLHAESISFLSPEGARLTVSAELPKDLSQALHRVSHGLADHLTHS